MKITLKYIENQSSIDDILVQLEHRDLDEEGEPVGDYKFKKVRVPVVGATDFFKRETKVTLNLLESVINEYLLTEDGEEKLILR